VHIDLRGGQTHAVGVMHGFKHVVDKLADARVHLSHGLGHRVQARVWVLKNG
jgi:hypothetical protein